MKTELDKLYPNRFNSLVRDGIMVNLLKELKAIDPEANWRRTAHKLIAFYRAGHKLWYLNYGYDTNKKLYFIENDFNILLIEAPTLIGVETKRKLLYPQQKE